MKMLAILVALATCAFANPKTPLGRYARPGVPAVLTSDSPVDVNIAGWTWRVDGIGTLAVPRVPCTVVHDGGSIALRAVPEDKLLVGIIGPGQLPEVPNTVVARVELVDGIPWVALDLFDRIVWTGVDRPTAGQTALLLRWVRMGGDLVAPRGVFEAEDSGLGRLQSVGGQNEAEPARRHPIPRLGNAIPEIYDLAPARGDGSPALLHLRNVFFGMALVLLLGFLGGAGGWIGRRLFWGLTLAVVVVAAGLGTWLTRRAFEPLAEARIEITYFASPPSEYSRSRIFRVVRATGGDARLPARDGIPLFYRAAGDAWWSAPDGPLAFDEGVSRAFLVDREVLGVSPGEPGGDDPRELRRLLRRVAPQDGKPGWQWGTRVLRPFGRVTESLLSVDIVAVR